MKQNFITKISFCTQKKHLDDLINHIYLSGISSFEEQENSVILYLNPKEVLEVINNISLNFTKGSLDIKIENIRNRNWNEEWQKSIEPIFIDNKLIVYPTWKKEIVKKYKNYIKIQIDPKMAFGTGHNETTQLVLELMLKYIDVKDKYLLDFGCGTGILAIAGLKMGLEKVVANDIDVDSIENAIENFKLNRVFNNVKLYQNSIRDLNEKGFDIICANIISSVIIESLDSIFEKLKRNGKLILSGILKNEERRIKNALKKIGFEVTEVKRKSEWIGVYAVKDNSK